MIKWFKYLFLGALLIGSIILGAVFTSQNDQAVSVVLFGFELTELTFGMWLLCFLLVGSFIGLLLSFLPILWGRQSRASKERKIAKLEKEISQLRSASIKG
ncbi:MAG: lipopolysaccharide assembly protein LapA domain-containing protein [Cellvibrionaceae bacterium]